MRRAFLSLVLVAAVVITAALYARQAPTTPPAGAGPGTGRADLGIQGRGGVQIQAGEECPAGMTEVRPNLCQPPEFPPPTIVDYRPRATLVTSEHLVPKAKFPAIDIHGHPPSLTSEESIGKVAAAMDALNIRVLVSADNTSGERLQQMLTAIKASPHRDRFRVLTGIDFRNVGPGWADKTIRQLEADLKAGAVGVGEVPKSFGLLIRKPDGSRLKIDDPELDPVWDALGKMKVPVFIHTAEPQEFFQPIDNHNERWLELSLFKDRRNSGPGHVTFDELMTERDNVFRKHPNTQFIAAHLGWHANDLGRAAKMLDAFPNVVTEVGAVLYDIGRQPHSAHEFFIKYQDRILFGKDSFQPAEYPYYWRVFETKDEYFDYYRNYHAFWKLYGIDLPDGVLKKLYFQNALRVTTGLPKAGWPQ